MTLSKYFMESIAKYVDKMVHSADYTIDNEIRPIGVRRSIVDGSTVKKHVYLTTKDPVGTITQVRLLDKEGRVLAQLDGRVEHEKNTGRLFEFVIKVEEG